MVVTHHFGLFGNSCNANATQIPRHRSGDNLIIATALLAATRRDQDDDDLSAAWPRAASYSRYSSSGQREESVTDQQRRCRDAAHDKGHLILDELEFADHAVSGAKLRRKGLDALLAAAESRQFDVLYIFSLSRLARESVITMPVLKRLVGRFQVRVISVSEGIDSANDNWSMIAAMYGIIHERYLDELAANVLRGQEGALLQGWCIGDQRFGYASEPIIGSDAGRQGKRPKPRMQYVIDQVAAEWVRRIFNWFVVDRWSLKQITKELNRLGAPKDHRASTKLWFHQQVTALLGCRKYIGEWEWGVMMNQRDPETGQISQRPRELRDRASWSRNLPHLRIIDDATFDAAQARLAENRARFVDVRGPDGQFKKSPGVARPRTARHLLSGILTCESCGGAFHVRGRNAQYLGCSGPSRTDCPCRTTVRRELAERLILDELGSQVLSDPTWLSEVVEKTTAAQQRRMQDMPDELKAMEKQLADAQTSVSRLVDALESGADFHELHDRIVRRRAECSALQVRVESLRARQTSTPPELTPEWIKGQLAALGDVLRSGGAQGNKALRDLIGNVIVREITQPYTGKVYLQGTFKVASSALVSVSLGSNNDGADLPQRLTEVTIDFVEPSALDVAADEAKRLYDENLPMKEVARRLGVKRSRITKLIKHWHQMRGLVAPDGRGRRSQTTDPDRCRPLHETISDEVWELCLRDMPLQDVAKKLGVDRGIVTRAIRYWHELRDLPVPDGRTLRKERNARRKSGESELAELAALVDLNAEIGTSIDLPRSTPSA